MIDPAVIPDFDEPIAAHARKDLPLLHVGMTVQEALARTTTMPGAAGLMRSSKHMAFHLAVTDFVALLFYFGIAAMVL